MKIEQNKSLKEYTSFMVPASARYFVAIQSENDLLKLMQTQQWYNHQHCILGEGSNVLFTEDFDGIIIKNNIIGRKIILETDDTIVVRVGAGENWHEFVMWSVEQGYWGIENLALIPGTVGASPVQNIGAYGVDVASVVVSVETIHLLDEAKKDFSYEECDFSYRNSFFKENDGEYCISYVHFELSKKPKLQTSYPLIKESLEALSIHEPTSLDVAHVIIDIRNSKLPKLGELGMAGSFFENPTISKEHFLKIKNKFPQVKYFELENNLVKIPAGWIIEELGYKGFREGNTGTYEKHALVLVNYGNATGQEIWKFAEKIMNEAYEVFGIDLEPEVRIM